MESPNQYLCANIPINWQQIIFAQKCILILESFQRVAVRFATQRGIPNAKMGNL
jgi:hypothetical protein